MDFLAPILKELASRATAEIFSRLPKGETQPERVTFKIESHLRQVSNWCQRIQFFGMTEPRDTARDTIDLSFNIPRRFRAHDPGEPNIGETDFLLDAKHYLLLGDPGSGKTTTLKRLSRHLLLENPLGSELDWGFPVVILLRHLYPESPLRGASDNDIDQPYYGHLIFEAIAESLAVDFTYQKTVELAESRERSVRIPFVGEMRLDEMITEVLDSLGAVLILDGLDEVHSDMRAGLEASLDSLVTRLSRAKIILSCRSGDYMRNFPGFSVVEICPLEASQMRAIAEKWLTDGSEFLERVSSLPFFDLAARPLLLCQLITIYKHQGYLPEEPSAIYRKMTSLLLEEWDRTRGVQRRSLYSRFFPEQKLDFLAALSYHLTYLLRVKRFERRDLTRVYLLLHEAFDLPKGEALEVAREIETHNGLIVESGFEHFEFSHLSLQEYLCAYYLVRDPFGDHFFSYLHEYPAPVAIAASLSADPGRWLAHLVLRHDFENVPEKSTASFLSRLSQERPRFTTSRVLGFALLKLLFRHGFRLRSCFDYLLSLPALRASIMEALQWYIPNAVKSHDTGVWLDKLPGSPLRGNLYPPEQGSLPRYAWDICRGDGVVKGEAE